MKQRADVFSGGSFASTSDMRPHFGLGSNAPDPAASLEVRWPGGLVETFPVPTVDRFITLTEGKGAAIARPKL
jgi:hypothetical protein